MKTLIKLIFSFLILSLSVTSCIKDDHQELLETEMRLLKQYILDKNYNIEPTASGLYYIEQETGPGAKPAIGDYLLLEYTGRLLEGEIVFGTTEYLVAEDNDIVSSSLLYGPVKLQSGSISPIGISEGVQLMREGGKSRLIFPSTLGFGSYPISAIPAYSSLIYDIELIKVIPDPVEYENDMIQQYLTDNQIDQEPDSDGLYYIETLKGIGESPTNNNTVEVLYSAYLLDGRRIAATGTTVSNIQLHDYLQNYASPNFTVKGLRDAIKKMSPGGKAIVIVPYNLAFGTASVDASGLGYKYPVPGYSTIVYDIELVAIK